MSHQTTIQSYLTKASTANTEEAKKQLFNQLLMELFSKDSEAKEIISQMAGGAEKAIFSFTKGYYVGDYSVGKVRLEVKRELKGEMEEIDRVWENII